MFLQSDTPQKALFQAEIVHPRLGRMESAMDWEIPRKRHRMFTFQVFPTPQLHSFNAIARPNETRKSLVTTASD